jgi:hypothetical protein
MTKPARAPRLNPEHVEKTLIQSCIDNVGKKFVTALDAVDENKLLSLLTLSDDEFWAEIKFMALAQSLINNVSEEK